MESTLVRALIEQGRREYYPQAKLWPNGLGFDYRGWSWGFMEPVGKWVVVKTVRGREVRGIGENPFDAYCHAVPLKVEQV